MNKYITHNFDEIPLGLILGKTFPNVPQAELAQVA